MTAEILSTGDELRSGVTIDQNAAYIAEKLEAMGIEVARHTCVGDEFAVLESILREIASRSKVAVVTGGLGPTSDDLTKEVAATLAGVELVEDKTSRQSIERYFAVRSIPPGSEGQVMSRLPEGATCIPNPRGAAPGFTLDINGCRFYFLPGVPSETRVMLAEEVLPDLATRFETDGPVSRVATLRTFGATEPAIGEMLTGLPEQCPGVGLGLHGLFPEIHVKLYCRGVSREVVDRALAEAAKWVRGKLGRKVFSADGLTMADVVGRLLTARGEDLAVAEIGTGGKIADLATDAPNHFAFLKMSLVTPLSGEEDARERAESVRSLAGTTYGLAVLGPCGEGPVGPVFIALASSTETRVRQFRFSFGSPALRKSIYAMSALDLLRRRLVRLEEGSPLV